MKKRILFTTLGLLVVLGILAGIKTLQIRKMIEQGKNVVIPPEVVTAAQVQSSSWESTLSAVGTLEAVQGVTVAAEISGKVERIAFAAGKRVAAGALLVQQDVAAEQAQLNSAAAAAELARIDFQRFEALLPSHAISQADYDNARARLTQALAQMDNIKALIAKKTIRAPFAGRLGIRLVNLGQIIQDGQAVVSLQSLDPVYVNFTLPQQQLGKIRPGLPVRVVSDALPDRVLSGKITAIEPEVEVATRNLRIQALLANPDEQLRAGMFVNVTVVLPETEAVLTIPATAVLYAPYSDSVFVITEKGAEGGAGAGTMVRQQFVNLGEQRGDFIVVASGLTAGETIVSTGVFKLRNGQSVVVDNTLAPEFKLAPRPGEG